MANFLDKNGLTYFWGKVKAAIPTNTSQLTNDSGYLTSAEGMTTSVYDPQGKAQDVFAYVDNNTMTTHHLTKQLSVQGWYRVAVTSLGAGSSRARSDVLRLIFGGAWESTYPRGFVVEAYVGCFQNGVFRQYPAQDVPQQITKVRMTTMDVNPNVFYLDVYYASTLTNTVYLTIQTPFGTCEPVNFESVGETSESGTLNTCEAVTEWKSSPDLNASIMRLSSAICAKTRSSIWL